ncbi:unnamed protein product [Discosporangium mesarthrocarpum]
MLRPLMQSLRHLPTCPSHPQKYFHNSQTLFEFLHAGTDKQSGFRCGDHGFLSQLKIYRGYKPLVLKSQVFAYLLNHAIGLEDHVPGVDEGG